jgi:hypothetical protein
MWTTDAFCSCRKEVSWAPRRRRATVTRGRRRRTRKTSVLTARHGAVMVSLLATSWHGVTLASQTKNPNDDHPDGPESPLGGRGRWSACSSTPFHLIGSALRGCRMDRLRKPSPCGAISFLSDRLVRPIDPLGAVDDGADLITGPSSFLTPSLPHRSQSLRIDSFPLNALIFTSIPSHLFSCLAALALSKDRPFQHLGTALRVLKEFFVASTWQLFTKSRIECSATRSSYNIVSSLRLVDSPRLHLPFFNLHAHKLSGVMYCTTLSKPPLNVGVN